VESPEHEELAFRETLLDESLGQERVAFCRAAVAGLVGVSGWLAFDSWLGGGDVGMRSGRIASVEHEETRYQAFRGIATVVEMATELSVAIVSLLDDEARYAAAALVRQLIETEYLLQAFASDLARGAEWYQATPAEIRKAFELKTMRKVGGFSDTEYWSHCDQGGHPSPRGRHLLGYGSSRSSELAALVAASLWSDLAQHLQRVWAAVVRLLAAHHPRFATVRVEQTAQVEAAERRWASLDPLASVAR
jgi:hypothetical protein